MTVYPITLNVPRPAYEQIKRAALVLIAYVTPCARRDLQWRGGVECLGVYGSGHYGASRNSFGYLRT